MVVGKCPISSRRGLFGSFPHDVCKRCKFFDDNFCSMMEYHTKLKSKRVEIDDDPFGALTPDDYYYTIECYRCSSNVLFHSSYSHLTKGDTGKCLKCGLEHVYLRRKGEYLVFAISLKDLGAMKVRLNEG